jgi:hypothetical protein
VGCCASGVHIIIIYYFVSYLLSWGSLRHIRQITITFTRARENEMRDIVTSIACRRMPGCHRLYVTMTKCEMRGRHCHGGVLSLSPLPMQILPLILHLILHFILWCSASSSPKNFSDLSLSSPLLALVPCPPSQSLSRNRLLPRFRLGNHLLLGTAFRVPW